MKYADFASQTLGYFALLLKDPGLRVEHEVHISLSVQMNCLIQIDCFQREGPLLTVR
jgi:hypothetical protein